MTSITETPYFQAFRQLRSMLEPHADDVPLGVFHRVLALTGEESPQFAQVNVEWQERMVTNGQFVVLTDSLIVVGDWANVRHGTNQLTGEETFSAAAAARSGLRKIELPSDAEQSRYWMAEPNEFQPAPWNDGGKVTLHYAELGPVTLPLSRRVSNDEFQETLKGLLRDLTRA